MSLEREELEKRRRQQRHDGLPEELSPSSSSLDPSSDDDDEVEAGRGPLDHLPDVRGAAPGASASGLTSPGGGEGVSGLATARPRAEADSPEARASGKRAVSPRDPMADMEWAMVGAIQPHPQRDEGASESGEGRLAPADTEVVPPPPPLPLQRTRDAVPKRLCPCSR